MDVTPSGPSSAGASRGRLEWRGQRSREDTSTSEGDSSDHSRSSSLERGESTNGNPVKMSKRRSTALRPLKTVSEITSSLFQVSFSLTQSATSNSCFVTFQHKNCYISSLKLCWVQWIITRFIFTFLDSLVSTHYWLPQEAALKNKR